MSFLSSLDKRDRRLLFGSFGAAIVLAVLIGLILPNSNGKDNPLPSTYLAGEHGALAAYEMLLRANYPIERWERPLSELAEQAGPGTVVLFAEPTTHDTDDLKAILTILEHGGRVLATGASGGFLLPNGQAGPSKAFDFAACKLDPEGLDPLASTGEIWMVPASTWKPNDPAHRTQFSCAGQPAVVEYDFGKGHVVWWASSTPLENGSVARANNLDLLLNSLGPREGHQFYWDESLHGDVRTNWSYAAGASMTLLRVGLLLLALLIVFSFSRRSGPVRDLPLPVRAAPTEFLDALGSLYRSAGASSTAVAVALERFRRQGLRLCGLRSKAIGAVDLAALLRSRFPNAPSELESDLAAAEEASWSELVEPRAALRLIQALHSHQQALARAASLSHSNTEPKERAS